MLLASAFVSLSVFKEKRGLKSRQFIIWIVLMLWMCLCTFINDQSLLYPVYYVGQVAFWILINDLYLEKGSLRLLRAERSFVGIVIIVTFLQQIFAPGIMGYTGAMNSRNIFASDNYLGYYYTAYIAVCFILDFAEGEKIQPKTYIMTGLCFASIIRAWSVKSVIGIGILIIYILFFYRKKISRILGPRTITVLFILIFLGVVIFNFQEYLLGFFSKYLRKSSTISVRYYLWVQAIANIRSHPWFGYGIREGQRLLLQESMAGNARSSHNIILELILEGGFVGCVIYLSSVVVALAKRKDSFTEKNRHEYLFLLFIIFTFFVMQLASGSVYYPFYYMPIILVNNLDKIVKIKENNNPL